MSSRCPSELGAEPGNVVTGTVTMASVGAIALLLMFLASVDKRRARK
jgi:hypothetical protein